MPQPRCPYYFEQPKTALGYCEHKRSPVRRADVLSASVSPLKCGGDFSKCQVPLRWRLDIWERAMFDSERDRAAAEGTRATAEEGRIAAELERVGSESSRDTSEKLRAIAESIRQEFESLRIAAEGSRAFAEQARAAAYEARVSAGGRSFRSA